MVAWGTGPVALECGVLFKFRWKETKTEAKWLMSLTLQGFMDLPKWKSSITGVAEEEEAGNLVLRILRGVYISYNGCPLHLQICYTFLY